MNPISAKLLVARASLALLLVVAGVPAQEAPKGNPYPEHGKVITTRLGIETVGSAGSVGSLKRWIYRPSASARMLISELKSKRPI